MTASGFKVRVIGLVFIFKSASLVLKQVPTCIRKRQIPLISQLSFYIGYFWSFQMVLGHLRTFLDGFSSCQMVLGRFRSFQLVPHFSKYRSLSQWVFEEISTFVETDIEQFSLCIREMDILRPFSLSDFIQKLQ